MNNIKERIKIFSGAQLKYIAFLSMLIDHTNKALIYPNLDGGALNRLSDFYRISNIHLPSRGRLFPHKK